ncbi:TBC1 domain family member 14 isoform X1, partial [Tachysurus ichikawai]
TEEPQSIEQLSQRQRDAPATLKLEAVDEGGASSQVRGGALVYRDSTSVCSTSSLSTDFSATLSLGNDDAAGDFVVTSDSSAVVDFHDFSDFSRFPQATAINIVQRDHPHQHHCEAVAKKESPIVNFFNRCECEQTMLGMGGVLKNGGSTPLDSVVNGLQTGQWRPDDLQ